MDRRTSDLAPETRNAEQDDAPEQAQTLAAEALANESGRTSPTESARHTSDADFSDDDTQDVVDHMRDMENSGRIDMDAFDGEDNHDDNEDKYGPGAKVDPQLPSDGS